MPRPRHPRGPNPGRRALATARAGMLPIAVLSLFIVIGAGFFALGVRNAWRAARSAHWPTAPGEVIASSTDTTVTRDSRSRRADRSYEARVVARYAVAGRTYETDQRRFAGTVGSGDPSDAGVLRLRYPRGAEVTVAYDPDLPSRAVLEPGLSAEALWLPAAGLAFATVGAMAIALYRGGTGGGGGATLGLTIFGGVFCTIGAALLTPGLVGLARARASSGWPSVPGTIVMGQPVPLPPDADPDSVERWEAANDSSGAVLQAGRLVYAYDVAGRRHYANRRTFNQVSRGGGEGDVAIAERYPIGRAVTVRHAPGRPDLAVIEPGIAGEAWLLPAAGAAFLLFGLAVLRWGVPALAGP